MDDDFEDLKKLNEKEYGDMIQDTLFELLSEHGFRIYREESITKNKKQQIDFLAKWENNKSETYQIGIEYKYFSNPVEIGIDCIRQISRYNKSNSFDKFLIISNCRLSETANALLKSNLNDSIEFQKYNKFRNWVESIKDNFQTNYKESKEEKRIKIILIECCEKLIKEIANSSKALNFLEWRELEKTIAIAFEGIGYIVELTPPAKDGGKDIILKCKIEGIDKVFIIEVKHWRSNQKVGKNIVKDFVEVVVNEKRDKGLILATNGYTSNYLQLLTTLEKKKIEFADKNKIVEICQTYEKRKNGILLPENLEEFLFRKNHST